MLFGLWIASAAVLCLFIVLINFRERTSKGAAQKYRQKYQQLIGRLEGLVKDVKRMERSIEESNEANLAGQYLTLLKKLEALMGALKKIPAFGLSSDVFGAPIFLVQDLRVRLAQIEQNVAAHKRGKFIPGTAAKHGPAQSHLGCYFCSRPFEPTSFLKVRVRVDGKGVEVAACNICNQVLQGKKKAKVLFFQEDGKPVHWSTAKDYVPSEQFWKINDNTAVSVSRQTAPSHLTLAYSSMSSLDSHE